MRPPRSHLGSAEPSAEGSGQHGASRSSAAARLPAPAARRRGGSAPGTARGADRSGVRPVPAPGRPVRSSTDRFSVMGRVRVRLPWGGMGFTAGFSSRSRFLPQIPDCIPGYPLPVPLPAAQPSGDRDTPALPTAPEHSRSDGEHQEKHPQHLYCAGHGVRSGIMQREGGKVAPWRDKEEPSDQEEVSGSTRGVGLCQRTCLLQTWHCWPQDVGADNSGG